MTTSPTPAPLSAEDDGDDFLDNIGKLMDAIGAEEDARRAELEGWKARATQAEAERDELLAATGFKPGPLGDGMRRKVILDDVGGLRDAMVKARREAAKAQDDAALWRATADEEGVRQPLLLTVWKQRRAATAERDAAQAALAAAEVREAALRKAAQEVADTADAGILRDLAADADFARSRQIANLRAALSGAQQAQGGDIARELAEALSECRPIMEFAPPRFAGRIDRADAVIAKARASGLLPKREDGNG